MGIVTCDLSVSIDGYVAGPNQRLEAPFGDGAGMRLHRWRLEQPEENATEIAGILGARAYIMGRNMFNPNRGEWDLTWKGWWGEEPPFHAPVFVLTHYPRESLPMEGGTTFHFVTDGIESALAQARAAAGDANIAIAGGAATVNEYLAAGLLDELRLHIVPETNGAGARLFEGTGRIGLESISSRGNELVTHITYRVIH